MMAAAGATGPFPAAHEGLVGSEQLHREREAVGGKWAIDTSAALPEVVRNVRITATKVSPGSPPSVAAACSGIGEVRGHFHAFLRTQPYGETSIDRHYFDGIDMRTHVAHDGLMGDLLTVVSRRKPSLP